MIVPFVRLLHLGVKKENHPTKVKHQGIMNLSKKNATPTESTLHQSQPMASQSSVCNQTNSTVEQLEQTARSIRGFCSRVSRHKEVGHGCHVDLNTGKITLNVSYVVYKMCSENAIF